MERVRPIATKDPVPKSPPSAEGFRGGRDGSRGALVHEAIKSAIRDGALKAGQRIRERDVAHWLGVSRTPVREAFKMLHAQGVLSEAAGDGLVVTTLSEDEGRELYRVWADMEALAARYAARHASVADIRVLRDVSECWDANLGVQALGALNQRFHQAIHAAAHNRYISRALNAIDDSLALLGLNTYTIPGRPAEAGREHLAIVRAISKREPEAAFAAANAHIERAGKLRMALFKQQSH